MEEYWKLAKTGTLCDLSLVEISATGETREHRVHKLVMYAGSNYFKSLIEKPMKDATAEKLTIQTESSNVGLLGIVIEAMYANSLRAERVYYTYTGENSIEETMALYMLCSFLQLDAHMSYIESSFADNVKIGDLTVWWRKRQESGKEVPQVVEERVQEHLKSSTLSVKGTRYISIDALLCLWPDLDDPVSKSVKEFLTGLGTAVDTAGSEGNNDPNEWFDDDDNKNFVPATDEHPRLRICDAYSAVSKEGYKWCLIYGRNNYWAVGKKANGLPLDKKDLDLCAEKGWRVI